MKLKLTSAAGALALTLISSTLAPQSAQAAEWRVGAAVSYPSGANDVQDLYEDNLENSGFVVDSIDLLPIGIAFDAHYQWDSGLRAGAGFGPTLLIFGDVEHVEIPVNATIGFTFLPKANVSPYVKAGLVAHIVSGDYERGSTPGVLAAVGIEFARTKRVMYAFEVASDQSKVEFDVICRRASPFVACRNGITEFKTYDTVVSFMVKF